MTYLNTPYFDDITKTIHATPYDYNATIEGVSGDPQEINKLALGIFKYFNYDYASQPLDNERFNLKNTTITIKTTNENYEVTMNIPEIFQKTIPFSKKCSDEIAAIHNILNYRTSLRTYRKNATASQHALEDTSDITITFKRFDSVEMTEKEKKQLDEAIREGETTPRNFFKILKKTCSILLALFGFSGINHIVKFLSKKVSK